MLKNQSKKKPIVSIILNCFNGEKYLYESLKSVENQTYKNWELVFWDNKSTDNSKGIFKSFLHKKFRYFMSQKHTSLYEARNLAIQKAKGQFIAFIDSDDIWNKDKLKLQMKHFEDKEVAVVYGNLWLKKESLNEKKKHITYKIPDGYIHSNLINNYYVGILSSVIRRNCLGKSKKIFDDKYNIIGDYDLFLRLSKLYKFKAIQEPVATYRLHDSNFSNLNKKLEVFEFKNWLKKNKKSLKKEDCEKIKKKIKILEFVSLKFEDTFLKTLLFFFSSTNSLLSIKNILILVLPKIILKKFMWFS